MIFSVFDTEQKNIAGKGEIACTSNFFCHNVFKRLISKVKVMKVNRIKNDASRFTAFNAIFQILLTSCNGGKSFNESNNHSSL